MLETADEGDIAWLRRITVAPDVGRCRTRALLSKAGVNGTEDTDCWDDSTGSEEGRDSDEIFRGRRRGLPPENKGAGKRPGVGGRFSLLPGGVCLASLSHGILRGGMGGRAARMDATLRTQGRVMAAVEASYT